MTKQQFMVACSALDELYELADNDDDKEEILKIKIRIINLRRVENG